MSESLRARFGNLNFGLGIARQTEGEPSEERFDTLVAQKHVRIERIVSSGQSSPPDFWYDQTENEFVLVVSGRARLGFEHAGERELGPGDWVDIPAHVRHRVEWTSPTEPTIWLAVFSAPNTEAQ
ncbi:MAG TPA: cupin domain-containing protein [Polyangiaceae bacterium]|jgi:cupin 2 domain-containing protein|nr:cupin domain-containing protein [Polyangiaceae bacterium]